MKLTEANKELNRRFHELPEEEKEPFLLRAYSQVFPNASEQEGEFTPLKINSRDLKANMGSDDHIALNQTVDNLNFLMTRFNMTRNPSYAEHIRNLALLRFEYMMLKGSSEISQNPKLVVDFFSKRDKRDLIRPTLERMAEHGVDYEHIAEKVIDHSVFAQQMGEKAREYKFRSRMHVLIEDEDFEKEQVASALLDEGYDLISLDFNKWYEFNGDYKLKNGEKQYSPSEKNDEWLHRFVAKRKERTVFKAPSWDIEPKVPEDDEEPGRECGNSKEGIETLDARVKKTLEELGAKAEHWVKELSPLTADHRQLTIDPNSLVQSKMWDYLWGGGFNDLAYQLKGANPHGKTRKGLNYNRWALTHQEHRKGLNPVLAQDSYAMIVAGDLLVGDLEKLVEDLGNPELQEYKNPSKLRAAVNLAWDLWQQPGESDDADEYKPPRGYLFNVAKQFRNFLASNPSAAPYIKLMDATPQTQIGADQEEILRSMKGLGDVEVIYKQIGKDGKIKDRFLEILDEHYTEETKHAIWLNFFDTVRTIQDPIFRKYVDDSTLSDYLFRAITRTLTRKDEDDPERDYYGNKKIAAFVYSNPVIRPYLEGRLDMAKLVNDSLDHIVGRKDSLIHKPYSLRHQGELTFDGSEALEAYEMASAIRDQVDSDKFKDLVANIIATTLDDRHNNGVEMSSIVMNLKAEHEKASIDKDLFPDPRSGKKLSRFEFLSKFIQREKELGGYDSQRVSTAVSNIMFRSNYAVPMRYYPHLDTMMDFLNSPLAEVVPREGLGDDAIKEYRILHEYLGGQNATRP